MTLPISTTIIRNTVGYIDLEITMIGNFVNIIDNPNSSSEQIVDAENHIIQCSKNIGKLIKTLEEKTSWTMPSTGYTNKELQDKRII